MSGLYEITNIYLHKKIRLKVDCLAMYSFKYSDLRRVCEIPVQVEITDLTEHEIIFIVKAYCLLLGSPL